MVRVLYLVHNLGDPAVLRRVRMLELGGAEVTVAGFRRAGADISGLDNPISLGTTFDARFMQRMSSVFRALASATSRLKRAPRPDVVLARNLEMLVIANRVRPSVAPGAAIVYECLDIHRLMLRKDTAGRVLRGLERMMGRRSALLVTSSPAFLREYFEPHRQFAAPSLLIENKLIAETGGRGRNPAFWGAADGPIRIGWFGALRCRRSLEQLSSFSRKLEGRVEIILRGRPALTEFDDFHALVTAEPHLRFEGPYGARELKDIYSGVHFNWAIDYFEDGQNSRWLLPNRIYEGCFHGAIPMALAGTETAAFLTRHSIGIVLESTEPEVLVRTFSGMSRQRVAALAEAVAQCDPGLFAYRRADCQALVARLAGLGATPASELAVPT